MTVRLVEEYRHGAEVLAPGGLLELPDDEAMSLIVDGTAVPVSPGDLARETRGAPRTYGE